MLLRKLEAFVDKYVEAMMFVIVPLGTNLFLGARSYFIHWDDFSGHIGACWAVVIIAIVNSATALFAFVILEMRPSRSLGALLFQQVALIFIFAGVYRGYGLAGPDLPPISLGSPPLLFVGKGATALYFSVVTWTTTGYGDYTALPELRLIAAVQALTGYVFFGTIVGLTTHLVAGGARPPKTSVTVTFTLPPGANYSDDDFQRR